MALHAALFEGEVAAVALGAGREQVRGQPGDLVIAVGPGKTLESGAIAKPAVKKGDRILFSKYAGTDVNVDNVEHIIIREDDVLAVWE